MLLVLGDGALFKMLLAKPFALSIPATPVSLVKVCIAFLCITRLAVGGTASFEKARLPSTRGRHRAPAVSPESSRCVYKSLCTQSPQSSSRFAIIHPNPNPKVRITNGKQWRMHVQYPCVQHSGRGCVRCRPPKTFAVTQVQQASWQPRQETLVASCQASGQSNHLGNETLLRCAQPTQSFAQGSLAVPAVQDATCCYERI